MGGTSKSDRDATGQDQTSFGAPAADQEADDPCHPPPMRLVTKGWFTLKETQASVEEVQQMNRRGPERT